MLTGDRGDPIEPRPLHNRFGTALSLARQLLVDMDREALSYTLPTATADMLLSMLVEVLQYQPPEAKRQEKSVLTAINEPLNNPNIRYLRALDNPGYPSDE